MSTRIGILRSLMQSPAARRSVMAACALAPLLVLAPAGRAQPTAQQVTGHCNAALQNISGSTVNVVMNCLSELGLPESNLVRLAELVGHKLIDRLTADDREKLGLLRTALSVTQDAVENFFREIGKQNVAPEKLIERLAQIAQEHKNLVRQASALDADDPEIKGLRAQALAAIDAGRYDDAKLHLAKAGELDASAIQQLQAVADKRRLSAAEAKASLGRIALIEAQYRQAAAYFRAAFDMTPASYGEDRKKHRGAEADALHRQGDEKGDNDALGSAINIHRELLRETSRQRAPLEWAAAQNNLGWMLASLGERESGTARLEEAAGAFRAALQERTRERVPLDWAWTQNNLGVALWRVGERESGTVRLEEAVAALRAALQEFKRDREPLDWGMAQTNLGAVLFRLGERESGTARLEEAAAAFREALKERTRERAPRDWAATQHNLASALVRLAERESGTARLEEAIAAYRSALQEYTRERVPLYWALVEDSLGTALLTFGERDGGTARLEEAAAAYRAALQERTRERVPLDWAATQVNLGNALLRLGQREGGTERIGEAISAYRAALHELTRERVPLYWATTQNSLGIALRTLGERGGDAARLDEAVAAFRAALQERGRERVPLDWAATQVNLGAALASLSSREGGTARLEEALAALRAALQVFTRENALAMWAEAQTTLGVTLATLGEREGDAARLEEAIAALRATLQAYSRERGLQEWARTQVILSAVLTAYGVNQSRSAPIEEAIAAYKDVLPVFEQAGAGDAIKEQLATAETALDRARGRANFYAANYDAAASDFLRAVQRQPDQSYGVLWLYLARTRAGNPNATAELQANAAPLKRSDWPYPIVELFLARRTPDATLAAAGKPGEICEAQFYIGEWRLLQGKRTSAAQALKTAADNCPKGFEEFAAAQAELRRLGQLGRGPAPGSRRTQVR